MDPGGNPYERRVARLIAERAPAGFLFFLGCVVISTAFEVLHFPERRGAMLSFAAGFGVLAAATHALLRARPTWSIPALVAFVNLVGVALNAYHTLVAAPVAMCVWTLTALLGSAAVIVPWGGRMQALASLGALLAYPLSLLAGTTDALTWATGATYLLVVVAMSVVGAMLYARYIRTDIELAIALSEREARLQSYFDLAPVGTAILSTDGRCLEVNDELCRILGHTREELLTRRWEQLASPEVRADAAQLLANALHTTATERVETRLFRKDGHVIHAAVGLRALPGTAGFDHVYAVIQDVTGHKQVEEEREALLAQELVARREAEAASRAKDTFLATVSHELRTPLSPILTWAELLRSGQLNAEQTERGLAAISRNAGMQAQLIEDLLDVSRIVAGKLHLEPRPLDLAQVVREAVDIVGSIAGAKKVALEVALDAGPMPVSGDADRLRQVCWNLLSNAIKFTAREGTVRITLNRAANRVRITVSDTGRGIDPQLLPHIFERFRQGEPVQTREHSGLGIGLAIVRELVDLHDGQVWAESEGVGHGARFIVDLPLLPDEATAPPMAATMPRFAPLHGLRVLVVDDDPDSNDVVETLLTSCGAEVRAASSVATALTLLAGWRPDVLVSDLSMPGEDGYALIARLRARDSRYPRVPAVALTAYAGPSDQDQILSAGFQAHVRKPFHSSDLVSAIEAAARMRRVPEVPGEARGGH